MSKIDKTIPVIDICSLNGGKQGWTDIIAERFAPYLAIHPNLYRVHGHSFYHMVLFTSGSGFHTIDFTNYPVQAGEMYIMVPGQVHSWSFEGEVDGYVLNFSEGLFQSFLADPRYLERFDFLSGESAGPVIQLRSAGFKQVRTLFERIISEYAGNDTLRIDMLRIQLLELFMLLARDSQSSDTVSEKTHPNMILLHNFRKLLNQYYWQYKLPKDYAAMLYVTPNHLNALCRDLLGKPAGVLIRDRVLLEAKRQLVNTGSRIAGIAYDLGFADNSYFTKFFRKYTGMTPESFRLGLDAVTP